MKDPNWIAAIVGVLGLMATFVTGAFLFARYLSKAQYKSQLDEIKLNNTELERKFDEISSRYNQSLDRIKIGGEAGEAALSQKIHLDKQVYEIMKILGASGGSLYVPVKNSVGRVNGLAFLCIEPFSELKSKIIPLESIAGECFLSGESKINYAPATDIHHFKEADKISNYVPGNILNAPLKSGGVTIGVVQFLKKTGEGQFKLSEIDLVNAMKGDIEEKLINLSRNNKYLKLLGLEEESNSKEGSIL